MNRKLERLLKRWKRKAKEHVACARVLSARGHDIMAEANIEVSRAIFDCEEDLREVLGKVRRR